MFTPASWEVNQTPPGTEFGLQYSAARVESSLQGSTCHVDDRVGVCGVFLQYLDGFDCRQNQQFDLVTLCLALYFFHHRQSAVCSGTDDELAAFPGYVLRDGKWRVPKVIAEFLGRPFLAVADLPAIDDHIVLVGAVVDAEGAKGEIIEVHLCLLAVKDGVTNSSPHVGRVQPYRAMLNVTEGGAVETHRM